MTGVWLAVLMLMLGGTLLYFGAEWLIAGSSSLAPHHHYGDSGSQGV